MYNKHVEADHWHFLLHWDHHWVHIALFIQIKWYVQICLIVRFISILVYRNNICQEFLNDPLFTEWSWIPRDVWDCTLFDTARRHCIVPRNTYLSVYLQNASTSIHTLEKKCTSMSEYELIDLDHQVTKERIITSVTLNLSTIRYTYNVNLCRYENVWRYSHEPHSSVSKCES